jgi:hypothetical protein
LDEAVTLLTNEDKVALVSVKMAANENPLPLLLIDVIAAEDGGLLTEVSQM